jgi:hypothetical protein
MLSGFLVLWIAFAFLINQAPKYPRLLIVLPFVAYLVTVAVRLLGRLLERGLSRLGYRHGRRPGVVLAVTALVAIGAWNLAIAWDYVDRGRTEGEAIGSTGRYMASHPNQQFFLVGDETAPGPYPYFDRGHPDWWQLWLSRFSSKAQLNGTVRSDHLASFRPDPPFSLLLSRDFLVAAEPDLAARYPAGRFRNVTPSGQLMAFVVPAARTRSTTG